MGKKRVHELAKEFNIESKKIINDLTSMGVTVKSHMSTVEDGDIQKLYSIYKNKEETQVPNLPKNKNTDPTYQKPARQDNRRSHNEQHGSPGLVDRVPQRPPDKRFLDRPKQENRPVQAGRERDSKENQAGSRTAQAGNRGAQWGNRHAQGANRPNQAAGRPAQGANRPNQGTNRPPQGGSRPAQGANRPAHGGNRPAQGTGRPIQGSRPNQPKYGQGGGNPRSAQAAKGPGGRSQGGYKGRGQDKGGAVKMPKPDQSALIDSRNKAEEKAKSIERQKAQEKFAHKDRQRDKNKFNERKIDFPKNRGQKKNRFAGKKQEKNISTVQQKKPITIHEVISVQEFASKMGKTAAEVIKKLMNLGIMATINQEIDAETAQILATDFGYEVNVKPEENEETMLQAIEIEDAPEDLVPRPCVVTVMGHVDHGKTSLLDAIRKTNVTSTEAGGITQHIGAYQVERSGKKITFVDTPGHEAFTAMRARGAQVTDIAVLVVAADDGVMPQTVEAINHAKAAEVPIIVAINKIDKDNAVPDRVKQELTEHELVVEEWGGDTISVNVSALKKEGIDELLEMILLVSEMAELKANPNRPAKGTVIEAELDKGRGPVATVLVQNGTLRVGDSIVSGPAFGKVRAMMDDRGRRVEEAEPSQPVVVLGFHEVPQAGDIFQAVDDEKLARYVASKRQTKKREEGLKVAPKVSLDDLFRHIQEGSIKELPLIIKADVQGSVEALKQSLERLSTDEVKVKLIHGGVGAVSESDIMLASTTGAIIIGFNVRPDANTLKAAETEQVDVRLYRVIYDAIDDVKAAMSGLLDPEFKEVVLGQAEVRQLFKVSKVGTIAGCYVTEGKITRDAGVRVIRNGIVVHEGKLDSLKRFKDDAKEVSQGYECGIMLEKFNDLKEQDLIEAYTTEAVKRELA